MKRTLLLILLLFLYFNTGIAQTKKTKKGITKSKPIAVVTTVGNLPPDVPLPNENDQNIWNEYKNEEFDFSIVFPSKVEDVFDNNDVKNLYEFSSETNFANYRVMVQRIAAKLDNKAVDALLEDIFKNIFNPQKSRLISKKDVYFRDKLGKEFITEDAVFGGKEKRINFMRAFIIEGKGFILNVSVKKNAYTPTTEKWAMKFLDSFWVKIGEKSLT